MEWIASGPEDLHSHKVVLVSFSPGSGFSSQCFPTTVVEKLREDKQNTS